MANQSGAADDKVTKAKFRVIGGSGKAIDVCFNPETLLVRVYSSDSGL